MSKIDIIPFDARDEVGLSVLLQTSDLSTEDITPEMLEHFLVAHVGNMLVGAAGVDVQGDAGLLRSVVVDENHRGTGIGKLLVEAAEEHARDAGVRELYLLTVTAENFFAGLGYRSVPREQAPPGVAAMEQFSSLCPSSSRFMVKALVQS